jgi:hypothetical protein
MRPQPGGRVRAERGSQQAQPQRPPPAAAAVAPTKGTLLLARVTVRGIT